MAELKCPPEKINEAKKKGKVCNLTTGNIISIREAEKVKKMIQEEYNRTFIVDADGGVAGLLEEIELQISIGKKKKKRTKIVIEEPIESPPKPKKGKKKTKTPSPPKAKKGKKKVKESPPKSKTPSPPKAKKDKKKPKEETPPPKVVTPPSTPKKKVTIEEPPVSKGKEKSCVDDYYCAKDEACDVDDGKCKPFSGKIAAFLAEGGRRFIGKKADLEEMVKMYDLKGKFIDPKPEETAQAQSAEPFIAKSQQSRRKFEDMVGECIGLSD